MKVKDKQIKEIHALEVEARKNVDSEEAYLQKLSNDEALQLTRLYKMHVEIRAGWVGQLKAYHKVIKILELNEQIH